MQKSVKVVSLLNCLVCLTLQYYCQLLTFMEFIFHLRVVPGWKVSCRAAIVRMIHAFEWYLSRFISILSTALIVSSSDAMFS